MEGRRGGPRCEGESPHRRVSLCLPRLREQSSCRGGGGRGGSATCALECASRRRKLRGHGGFGNRARAARAPPRSPACRGTAPGCTLRSPGSRSGRALSSPRRSGPRPCSRRSERGYVFVGQRAVQRGGRAPRAQPRRAADAGGGGRSSRSKEAVAPHHPDAQRHVFSPSSAPPAQQTPWPLHPVLKYSEQLALSRRLESLRRRQGSVRRRSGAGGGGAGAIFEHVSRNARWWARTRSRARRWARR